jgi:endonuclease/exonuclease/phosphatase (EEP) superfamily protein YafD
MTWNIWHGGLHGTSASDFESDTANTLNVLKVIQMEDPDILFMQETYCCGMDIAKEAGYPYSWRGSSNLSIHSKYPIIDTLKVYKEFNSHGAIIDVEGQEIMCFNIWLHYLPDVFRDIMHYSPDSLIAGEGTSRLKEIAEILDQVDNLSEIKGLPIIMGGDFNSGSHLDWVESTRQYHYDKVVEWPVSKMMQDRGYTDSFREVHPDPTLTLEGTWGYLNDEIISDRIDFIYYRGEKLQTTDSKIVMDDPPGGFFNSDHRAILSTFQINQ